MHSHRVELERSFQAVVATQVLDYVQLVAFSSHGAVTLRQTKAHDQRFFEIYYNLWIGRGRARPENGATALGLLIPKCRAAKLQGRKLGQAVLVMLNAVVADHAEI